MTTDEKQLIKALHNEGTKREAFATMVRIHQEMLYCIIRRIVLVHEDADDVLQNTFIKAWQGIDGFRGDSSLKTWLYRIATHEAFDLLEKKKKITVSIDDEESNVGTKLAQSLESDVYFDGDETELELQKAIATLPYKQKLVFNMKYFEDMKYEEISEVLGTSVGALKASYHHAVQKISNFLGIND